MLQKLSLFLFSFCAVASVMAAEPFSSDSIAYNRDIDDVVVTGTRGAADIRHLPMTISVVGEQKLNEHQRGLWRQHRRFGRYDATRHLVGSRPDDGARRWTSTVSGHLWSFHLR